MEDTYVDDIQGGAGKEEDVATFKEESIKILSEGGFSLHKWYSNAEHLNSGIKLVKKRLAPRVWWETKEAVKQKFLELNGTRKATH